MKDLSALSLSPKARIKPYDGMSISATVWAQAHDEHRLASQARDLLFHGSGIITGLEVIANDPPSQIVFISPGAAVDSAGNLIILPEPVAYDFGNASEGLLYLMLGHGEREVGGVESDLKYLQNEFVIAARPSLPKRPAVELGRLVINSKVKVARNAVNPTRPVEGEIDLRFRNFIGPEATQIVRLGLHSLGQEIAEINSGWDFLCRECARVSPYRLVVDGDVPISEQLLSFDLVYLYADRAFTANEKKLAALRTYLTSGHCLIIEAFNPAAEDSCKALLAGLTVNAQVPEVGQPLLSEPFLFTAPPPGFRDGVVLAAENLIYSSAGYGLAWSGKFEAGVTSRGDIRAAHEWGINLLHYCLQRAG
jgi:hypothetical protein